MDGIIINEYEKYVQKTEIHDKQARWTKVMSCIMVFVISTV